MKKTLILLAASALVLGGGLLTSCGKESNPPKQDTLSVDVPGIDFDVNDDKTVTVKVTKTAATYEAKCPDTWVKITPSDESFTVGVTEYTYEEAEKAEFKAREATITVTSGTAEPATVAVKQASPSQVIVYSISTDPMELVFAPGETNLTADITTDSPSPVTVSIPAEFTWITDASITANVLSVTVSNYVGTQDRTGHVLLSSPDVENDFQLPVLQEPVAPLDLEGTWNYTAKRWNNDYTYTEITGTVTATYVQAYNHYKFSTLPETLIGSGLYGDPQTDGAVALKVDAENGVTFVAYDKLDIMALLMGGMLGGYSYHNYAGFVNTADLKNLTQIKNNEVIDITASADGNTITFPVTGMNESVGSDCVFGFGAVGTDGVNEMPSEVMTKAGLFNSMVFTR